MIPWRARFLAARARVRSPQRLFSHYVHHDTWHVCHYMQHLIFDSPEWIEVAW